MEGEEPPFGPLVLWERGRSCLVVGSHYSSAWWSLPGAHAHQPDGLIAADASVDLLPGLLLKRGQTSVSEGPCPRFRASGPSGSNERMGLQVPCSTPVTSPSASSQDGQSSWLGAQLRGVLLLLVRLTVIWETLDLGLVKRLNRS